jgi:hypothetical protein
MVAMELVLRTGMLSAVLRLARFLFKVHIK